MEKISHMTPFETEREDWIRVREGMEILIAKYGTGFLPSEVVTAYQLAKNYSSREFPSYQMHKFPTSFQTVDNVIIWREEARILLGRKLHEPKWRFPGGFVDPKDWSLESAAIRERTEEVGINLECTNPEYLFNFRVPDPRYENSPDKIMSAVFLSYMLYGFAEAGDDLALVRWYSIPYLKKNYQKIIMPCHLPIIRALINKKII